MKIMLCATRALKNVKKIKELVPDAFPATEPLVGYASIVPFDVLSRFHLMSETQLSKYPKLVEASRLLHKQVHPPPVVAPPVIVPPTPTASIRPHGIIFADDPFKGTIFFAQIKFQINANNFIVTPDAVIATMQQYLKVALPAISQYCAQYGDNSLAVSTKVLTLTVQTPQGKYNDDTLQGWVRTLLLQVDTPIKNTCIVVINPGGMVNTDGDQSAGILGYHDNVVFTQGTGPTQQFIPSPYCFVNANAPTVTVDDRLDQYVDTLSHEVAEMTCDPYASHTNPEVCDACAGNCRKNWRSFFAIAPGGGFNYLRSASGIPPLPFKYDFYTAAVAQTAYPDKCPSPDWGCDYAPSAKQGVGELLFYEKADGYAELYSVDAKANLAIQTIHTDWRNTWSLIVPGRYTAKPAGSRADLLFYTPGHGEFYQTGLIGDMHQFSVHDNWRASWSIIVPGSFTTPGAMDLLFYEPSDGVGEFDHTDGNGNLTIVKDVPGWRTGWKIIIPGHFSNSSLTDLLFYSPSEGTGEFYSTDGKGNVNLIQSHTNWRGTWTIIVPGHFSNSPYTDLLFYSPSEGTGEIYSLDSKANITLLKSFTNFRKTWTQIVPCKASNSPYTDLLFYSPTEATGEFYSTDGHGNINLIQSHTNWRTTWTMIRSL
jgi:hypothetical protein